MPFDTRLIRISSRRATSVTTTGRSRRGADLDAAVLGHVAQLARDLAGEHADVHLLARRRLAAVLHARDPFQLAGEVHQALHVHLENLEHAGAPLRGSTVVVR